MKLVTPILPPSPGVYRILNAVTGRCYVGSSKNLRARYNQHKALMAAGTHHSTKLRNSLRKHGLDAFVFEVIELCEGHAVLAREAYWMASHDAVGGGYNVRQDPSSNAGVPVSAETRAKLSRARKGRKLPAETRAAISRASKGRDMSAKAKVSADRRRGRALPQETRAKIAAALAGVPKTPEHAAKAAESQRGRVLSDETRRKISEAQLGRTQPLEVVAKRVGRKQSAETVAKRVSKMLGVPHSEAHVEKRVAATAAAKGLDPTLRGVNFHKKRQQWRARLTVGGTEKHLGWFGSQAEAVEAREAYMRVRSDGGSAALCLRVTC